MDSWSDSWAHYSTRAPNPSEQRLYTHLLDCVRAEESVDVILQRFSQLFIEGMSYPEPMVLKAVLAIANTEHADQDFKFVLNRCCHIPINAWLMYPHTRSNIFQLIDLFDNATLKPARSREVQKLRERMQQFIQSEQYAALKRLPGILAIPETVDPEVAPIGQLIHRYPYLYEHSLLTVDNEASKQQRIQEIRREAEQWFEISLSHYAIARRKQKREDGQSALQSMPSGTRALQRAELSLGKNPTLLSDTELDRALFHFAGKSLGSQSYSDLASQFRLYSQDARTYRDLKHSLCDYLLDSMDAGNQRNWLSQRLKNALSRLYPDWDAARPHETLVLNTYRKLLNFLVVESADTFDHRGFAESILQLGYYATVGLLLKIVLLTHKVKPWLEKRFALMFNHFEQSFKQDVPWLVDSLEYLNIALSTNFGSTNFGAMNLQFF